LKSWSRQLSFLDWFYVVLFLFEKKSWKRLWLALRSSKRNKIQNLWQGALPLENIPDIKAFAGWVNNR
jgi:hypothetical protein